MTDAIVTAKGLTKRYGQTEVLHAIDFTIAPGRVVGLIGHNGAGKTTALNALLGLTDAQGTLNVLGLNPYANRARLMRDVAFISDVASLPRFLKVRELMALVADIHPNFSTERANDFLAGTDIRPEAKIKTLSKGMVAQLHLALVMAIDAKLLVLDEPTLGLDITYRKRFYRRLIEDYMTDDRAILITTHQVDEIAFMLTDVMFIRDGDIVLDCPTEEIGERFVQVIVEDGQEEAARALKPVFAETRFGRTVMVFDGTPASELDPVGALSTPSISDLFVALMQRETFNAGS